MTPLPLLPADSETYLPLSALNDLLFCSRRCYLHRREGIWIDNLHTVDGTLGHRRVHQSRDSNEGSHRVARGLWLVSHRMKLIGVTDLVEFHLQPDGREIPYPVEYKRGRRKKWNNDDVQLCAQALCLEEMLEIEIPAGAIFHTKSKRRREVLFDAKLRTKTLDAALRLYQVLEKLTAPAPVLHPKCRQCSLYSVCMPELISSQGQYQQSAQSLFQRPR